MRRLGVLVAVVALLFASCGNGEPKRAERAGSREVHNLTVEASDYKFKGVKRLASGQVRIRLTNSGTEPHQAQLVKLNDGVAVSELVQSAKKDSSGAGLFALGEFAGGPNAIDPRMSAVATGPLEAGRYAFICQVPDARGRSHLGLGMVAQLNVTKADEEPEAPRAQYSATGKDFRFELPSKWRGTVAFTNGGKQPHELQVIGVKEGKTPEDVEAWFKAPEGEAGAPTWTTGGGVAVIQPGRTASFKARVRPGTYFAMCFVFDREKKAPHFALGMMQRFEVEAGG